MKQLSSLKKAQTFLEFIDDLKLSIRHPQNKKRIFIIVEGKFDVRLYKNFYKKEKYEIREVAGGCSDLERAVEILSQESKQFIGIRDADFHHLEGTKPNCENVFLTDTSCAETMCLKSDKVILRIINENNLENDIEEFRSSCLQRIKFIGYARWYQYRSKLNLNFGFLKNHENIELSKENFIDELLERSPKVEVQREELLTEIEKLIDEKHDLFLLCNGHDLVSIIYKEASNTEANRPKGEIELILRDYAKEDFEKTSLYKSVMEKLK